MWAVNSDDESEYFSEGDKRNKGQEAANKFLANQERDQNKLDDTLADFIEEWRLMRQREESELSRLKARQAKRKVKRQQEEKRLKQQKKEEEERKAKEEAELKKREEEERLKRLEEIEKKKAEIQKKAGEEKKRRESLTVLHVGKGDKGKTKEQLAEEKKIAIMIRVPPLTGLEDMNLTSLCAKAEELYNKVRRLETEKYDMEMRRQRQDYDLRELKERQRVKLRHQALKKGLDAEALTGKHPPKVQISSKFERRADSRTYDEKKKLFEGAYESEYQDKIEAQWSERNKEFVERNKSKLPRWFGERPGKGADYYDDSDDEDEEEDDDDDYNGIDDDSEEEEEEEEDEEESEIEESEKGHEDEEEESSEGGTEFSSDEDEEEEEEEEEE